MIERLKPQYTAFLRPGARILSRMGVAPDVITVTGLALFCVGGWLTLSGHWRMALIPLVAGSLMDGLDGVVARETNRQSDFGAVLDSVCDRLTEIIWVGSIMAYAVRSQECAALFIYLAFAAITGSLMVSYARARAEGAGMHCYRGFMQRPERLIILAVFQMLGPALMPWGLGIIAAGAYGTVFQRLFLILRLTRKNKP